MVFRMVKDIVDKVQDMELLSTWAAFSVILRYGGNVLAEACQVLAESGCPGRRWQYML